MGTEVRGQLGGTGVTFDWALAKGLLEEGIPCMLAGGLTVDNVAQAVAQASPWGVDASSSLETSPGVKDHGVVTGFVQAAARAGSEFRVGPSESMA